MVFPTEASLFTILYSAALPIKRRLEHSLPSGFGAACLPFTTRLLPLSLPANRFACWNGVTKVSSGTWLNVNGASGGGAAEYLFFTGSFWRWG